MNILIGKCEGKCEKLIRVKNPAWPLLVAGVKVENPVAVVQVIDDEGVRALIAEKDLEIAELKKKLEDT